MDDEPEPTTGSDDLQQPEQKSSAIMLLQLAWVVILCGLCSACAIWVLAR